MVNKKKKKIASAYALYSAGIASRKVMSHEDRVARAYNVIYFVVRHLFPYSHKARVKPWHYDFKDKIV